LFSSPKASVTLLFFLLNRYKSVNTTSRPILSGCESLRKDIKRWVSNAEKQVLEFPTVIVILIYNISEFSINYENNFFSLKFIYIPIIIIFIMKFLFVNPKEERMRYPSYFFSVIFIVTALVQ